MLRRIIFLRYRFVVYETEINYLGILCTQSNVKFGHNNIKTGKDYKAVPYYLCKGKFFSESKPIETITPIFVDAFSDSYVKKKRQY